MKSTLSPLREMLSALANPIKTAALFTALGLASVQSASAAVIPYTNDFSGTGSNTAFPNENLDANWAVTGGAYAFNYSSSTVAASTSSLSLTNVGNVSFTMETQLTVGSSFNVNANGVTLGMGLFGSDANFTGTTTANSYYLIDWQIANTTSTNVGKLRILSLGNDLGFSAVDGVADDNASSTLALTLNTTYTMRLDGVYSNGTLVMTLGLYDGTGSLIGSTATATDSSPLTGSFFGYRNRVGIQGGAFGATFDNFSVTAVPEPGTVTMLALGAGVVLYGLRRRKTA